MSSADGSANFNSDSALSLTRFLCIIKECFFLFQLIESYLKMYLLFFSDSVFSVPPSSLESLLFSVSCGSELSCLTIKNLLISWLPGLLFFFFLT